MTMKASTLCGLHVVPPRQCGLFHDEQRSQNVVSSEPPTVRYLAVLLRPQPSPFGRTATDGRRS